MKTAQIAFVACLAIFFGLRVRTADGGSPTLKTVRVAGGLIRPLYVTPAPGDADRLFIVQQTGQIRILKPDGSLSTFLDIDPISSCCSERGLLGLAFHPRYADNGTFFVNYTDLVGGTVIARYTVSANPDVSNPIGSLVLTIAQPANNHNGGWIAFGPDGYLYIGMGDGGSHFDPGNRGQDITDMLLGKILRIDVDGDDFQDDDRRNYAIPATNPFVGREGDDEIWAYGLRNPWRCAFDPITHDLYIADVGEEFVEEINVQPASSGGGENYGWRCKEGDVCTAFGGCDCAEMDLVDPILTYTHGGEKVFRCSVTGGEVYRGCSMPELSGTYFYADYCSHQIWSFRYVGGVVTEWVERTVELTPDDGFSISNISSLGHDADGELYICDLFGGEVFKIVPDAPPLSIDSSDPPDGAIDARRPWGSDGVSAVGWDSVVLTMTGSAGCLEAADFQVFQEGASGTPPEIVSLEVVTDASVRIRFHQPIQPLAWTIITHVKSNTSVRLGYLPGDADGNRFSTPADILSLIDSLNGVTPLPAWSTDIDRSDMSAPADILELVDLLQGAGDHPSFNGARLP